MSNPMIKKAVFSIILLCLLLAVFSCKKDSDKINDRIIPDNEFKAEVIIGMDAITLPVNETAVINVSVKNTSAVTWPATGKTMVRFSYHILDKQGQMITWNGLRTPLPADLKSGEAVRLNALLQAPEKTGEYLVVFDLVQETISWFEYKKVFKPIKLKLNVK